MDLRGERELARIGRMVLEAVDADQAEVVLQNGTSSLTRFANNYIHQNVEETSLSVSVRAVLGKKIGVASTDVTRDDGLKAAAQRAVAIAKLQAENEDFVSLPGPTKVTSVDAWNAATAGFSPEDRARVVGQICGAAGAARLIAAGAFRTSRSEIAVLNSLGVSTYHRLATADINTVVMGETSSGWSQRMTLDASEIDGAQMAAEAIEKAQRGADPRQIEPGEYDVILEEDAVADILDYFAYLSLGAQAYVDKRSFMSGRIGERVMGDNVSIWDDGLSLQGVPMPFDYEGVAKQAVDFVVDGTAKGVVWDSYYGNMEKVPSTGHALPAGNTMGPIPGNLFMNTGDATKAEMIGATKRGILVSRFWYTRNVHPLTVVMTGMTRDGTFLIEDGRITKPLANLRFTQSYLEAMNHVEMIGRDSRLLPMETGAACRVPALKIRGWNFTGSTQQ